MATSRFVSALIVTLAIAVAASAPLALAGPAPAPQDKVRIAVMNFENNSQWTWWGDHLGEAAADEFVTQLFQSGKFSVVEREQINAILAEQDFGQSGRVRPDQAAEIGRILGVQVILTGSITKFSINEKGGGIGGFGVKYAEADSTVDVRLINVNTAEILFADEAEGTKRLGGIRVGGVSAYQDYDAGLAAEALRPAVEKMAEKIAGESGDLAAIQPPIPPAQIVGTGDSGLYIDKGQNFGVTVGQRYQVMRVVDEIKDASGNVLDRITEQVGILEVTRVLGQSSICTIVEGEAAEGDTLVPIG
ncbi:MAG: CsgG/HfaB family protein [Acidobacteriota bacterium]|jgi:curli biogenesis system outer membrane secretion channel CsgG